MADVQEEKSIIDLTEIDLEKLNKDAKDFIMYLVNTKDGEDNKVNLDTLYSLFVGLKPLVDAIPVGKDYISVVNTTGNTVLINVEKLREYVIGGKTAEYERIVPGSDPSTDIRDLQLDDRILLYRPANVENTDQEFKGFVKVSTLFDYKLNIDEWTGTFAIDMENFYFQFFDKTNNPTPKYYKVQGRKYVRSLFGMDTEITLQDLIDNPTKFWFPIKNMDKTDDSQGQNFSSGIVNFDTFDQFFFPNTKIDVTTDDFDPSNLNFLVKYATTSGDPAVTTYQRYILGYDDFKDFLLKDVNLPSFDKFNLTYNNVDDVISYIDEGISKTMDDTTFGSLRFWLKNDNVEDTIVNLFSIKDLENYFDNKLLPKSNLISDENLNNESDNIFIFGYETFSDNPNTKKSTINYTSIVNDISGRIETRIDDILGFTEESVISNINADYLFPCVDPDLPVEDKVFKPVSWTTMRNEMEDYLCIKDASQLPLQTEDPTLFPNQGDIPFYDYNGTAVPNERTQQRIKWKAVEEQDYIKYLESRIAALESAGGITPQTFDEWKAAQA
jgi:hypothetical protein